MKKLVKYLFTAMLCIFFSCEDSSTFTNCKDCTSDEPVETVISAELESNYYKGILVMLYEGRIEDGIVVDSIRIFNSDKYEKKVSLNRTYTITAKYIINDKSYTVVDSSTPRVKYTETMCNEPCYFVYDRMLTLRLKYSK